MVEQMGVCMDDNQACIQRCVPIPTTEKRAICFNACGSIAYTCREKSKVDYDACIATDKKPASQTEAKNLESTEIPAPSAESNQNNPSQVTQEPTKENKSILHRILGEFLVLEEIKSKDASELGLNFETISGRKIIITKNAEDEAWAFIPESKVLQGENITVIKGQGQIKSSDSSQPIGVSGTSNNSPAFSIFADSVFSGATSDMVQIRFTWAQDSGAVVNVAPKTEIRFIKPIQTDDADNKEVKRSIFLEKGEIEVKERNANNENKFGVQTDFLDLMVIGTHFWVSHDKDKNYTLVGVYEGEVEVKAKNGQTAKISAIGDRPGIIIIAQKFSVGRLAIAGIILLALIAGLAFFVKKFLK